MEYLPANADIQALIHFYRTVNASKDVMVTNTMFEYGKITTDYQIREGAAEQAVVFPYLYYKGYQVKENNQFLTVYNSPNFPGLCETRVKGKGTLEISYHWTNLQIFSTIVSTLGGIVTFYSIYHKEKKKQ